MNGRITEILLCPQAGADLLAVSAATLEAGRGIAGDRYHAQAGTFSDKMKPDREVTLIESEEIAAFNASTGLGYPAATLRRNLVTTGIRLNPLVGKEFMVGGTRLRGIRLCEPCAYLAGRIGPEVLQHMIHKCGLRAQIVAGGAISVGDEVAPVQQALGF